MVGEISGKFPSQGKSTGKFPQPNCQNKEQQPPRSSPKFPNSPKSTQKSKKKSPSQIQPATYFLPGRRKWKSLFLENVCLDNLSYHLSISFIVTQRYSTNTVASQLHKHTGFASFLWPNRYASTLFAICENRGLIRYICQLFEKFILVCSLFVELLQQFAQAETVFRNKLPPVRDGLGNFVNCCIVVACCGDKWLQCQDHFLTHG